MFARDETSVPNGAPREASVDTSLVRFIARARITAGRLLHAAYVSIRSVRCDLLYVLDLVLDLARAREREQRHHVRDRGGLVVLARGARFVLKFPARGPGGLERAVRLDRHLRSRRKVPVSGGDGRRELQGVLSCRTALSRPRRSAPWSCGSGPSFVDLHRREGPCEGQAACSRRAAQGDADLATPRMDRAASPPTIIPSGAVSCSSSA